MRMTTISDVIAHVIAPALGEHAGDYDMEAIAAETHEYRVDRQRELDTGGFEQTVSDTEFWQAVQRQQNGAHRA